MKSKKGLQKLTDLEKLISLDCLKEFLHEQPDKVHEVRELLGNKLSETYEKKLGKEEKITSMIEYCEQFQGNKPSIRNVTYEYNHALITTCIHNWVMNNKTFPTSAHIAEEAGVSRTTVYNHLKEGSLGNINALMKGKTEYLATQALSALYQIGIEDRNPTALKAFIDFSGIKADPTPQQTVNNFIQINNLKLAKEDFEQLPPETLSSIEKIISKHLRKE